MSEIIEVIDAGSVFVLLLDTPQGIEEVSVDHRMMAHIVDGEGLNDAQDLRGLEVDVNDGAILFAPAGGEPDEQ